MSTVISVGLAVQDFVFVMGERVIEGEKNFADAVAASGGGPAATAAVSAALLGETSMLVSSVGSDTIGASVVAELETFGVDCAMMRRVEAPTSMSAVIVAPDGERTIVNRTDPGLWSETPLPTDEELESADAVLVDSRWPAGAAEAVAVATKQGTPTIVDCDASDTPLPESILEAATYVICAEQAMGMYGLRPNLSGVTEAALRWGGTVAVTKGSAGVIWSDGAVTQQMPAFPIDAIDTLGAGDVFHGAFAVGVARQLPTVESLRLASAAAAIRCERGGGRSGIPNQTDIDSFLEVHV